MLGMRHPSLGMASLGLSNAKIRLLRATLRATPGLDGHPLEGMSFACAFSELVLFGPLVRNQHLPETEGEHSGQPTR